MIARFLTAHGLSLDSPDAREDGDSYTVLKWTEPALRLAIVVCLQRVQFDVDLRRDQRVKGGNLRSKQRISLSSDYSHPSADLTSLITEISDYRSTQKAGKKESA